MDSREETPAVRPIYHCNESSFRISDSPSSALLLTLQYQPCLMHLTPDRVAAEAVHLSSEHSPSVSHSLRSISHHLRSISQFSHHSISHALRSVPLPLCVFCHSPPALQRSRLQFHRLHVVVFSPSLFYHQSRYYPLASSAQTLRPFLFLSSRQTFERDLPAAAVLADAFLDWHPVKAS